MAPPGAVRYPRDGAEFGARGADGPPASVCLLALGLAPGFPYLVFC